MEAEWEVGKKGVMNGASEASATSAALVLYLVAVK
jgi:hypothetical protein